jgi:hypothetical protein
MNPFNLNLKFNRRMEGEFSIERAKELSREKIYLLFVNTTWIVQRISVIELYFVFLLE